ncbi:MAG: hypothetical protein KTR21_01645 [Rhodobacteraceae bacterium]|nr:hypothetical protein [Paracoccaceae bacterium]
MNEAWAIFAGFWAGARAQSPEHHAITAAMAAVVITVLVILWAHAAWRSRRARRRLTLEAGAAGSLRAECAALYRRLDEQRAAADCAAAEAAGVVKTLEEALDTLRREQLEAVVQAVNAGVGALQDEMQALAGDLARLRLQSAATPIQAASGGGGARSGVRFGEFLEPMNREGARLLEQLSSATDETISAEERAMMARLPSDPKEAGRLINSIQTRARALLESGGNRTATRLLARGVAAARQSGLMNLPIGLRLRYQEARARHLAGLSMDALEKVAVLVPLQERAFGEEHPDVLSTRWLEASLMEAVGRRKEALAKIEALAAVDARVRGADHPNTARTHWLHAKILCALSRKEEARGILFEILPKQRATMAEDHTHIRDTLELIAALSAEEVDALHKLKEPLKQLAGPKTTSKGKEEGEAVLLLGWGGLE